MLMDQENRHPKSGKKQEGLIGHNVDDSALTELFMCSNCTRTYRLKHSLLRHMRLECGKEPKYDCSHCNRKFKHKYDLNVHFRTKHNTAQQKENQPVIVPKTKRSL